jgi:Ca2+-binding EF-hand superfamily protein
MKADISQPGDRHERQADQVAGAIDSASSFSISPSGEASLMRQTPPAAQEEDPNVKFLKDQVNKLTATKFENDYKKGFDFYDANKDGNIDKSELTQLLTDAEVGNTLTRWKWVDGVMNQMDTNKDGKITWTEFDSAIHK